MSYNPFSLVGKTILVTGASSGIGQKTALECSKLGAKLYITGRNKERLNNTFTQLEGEGHVQILADLTNIDDLDLLAKQLPVLHGIVLCAGIGYLKPFLFSTQDQYRKVFDVNFFAPTELLRILVKYKKISKSASVVFVCSVGGTNYYSPGNSVYGTTKSALNSIMKYCAVELASKKIRVNSVNPGMIDTKMNTPEVLTEEHYLIDMQKYPLKRYGNVIDVALGIVYLLSDASSWITGHALVIDGGLTIN